jgi:hypothetical protein
VVCVTSELRPRFEEIYLDIKIHVIRVGDEAADGHLITGESELDYANAQIALEAQREAQGPQADEVE